MSGHKHADLMLEYAKDALTNKTPWELWEFKHKNENIWDVLCVHPSWSEDSQYRRKPVKWEPVGGDFYIRVNGDVWESPSGSAAREFGHERPTQKQAERAAVEMRKFNRLLALRDELCGDDVLMSWFSPDDRKYFIYFCHKQDRWNCTSDGTSESITPYFTTLKLAQKACDMLNSGAVEL